MCQSSGFLGLDAAHGRLRAQGFFQPAPVRHKWQEHLAGKRNWQYHLWNILMFQAWLEATSTTPP